MNNSVVVSKIVLVLDKMFKYIESKTANLSFAKKDDAAFVACCQWLMAAAKVEAPFDVVVKEDDFDNTLSYSRGVRVIGRENLGVVNFSLTANYKNSKVEVRNFISGLSQRKERFEMYDAAFSQLMKRMYKFGFKDQTGRQWDFALQSAKQALDCRAILIADGRYAEPMYDMQFSEIQFDNQPLKKWFKIKMNYFSGQLRFADEAYGASPIRMSECRCFTGVEHEFHIRRKISYDENGKRSFDGWSVISTKPADAVGFVLREMLVVKTIAEELNIEWLDAVELIETWDAMQMKSFMDSHKNIFFLGAQTRGAAIKSFMVDVNGIKMMREIAAKEGDVNPIVHLNGEEFPLDIREFAKRHICCIMSADAMKYGNGDVSYFNAWNRRVDDGFLEACAFVKSASDLKQRVTISRQLLTAMMGITKSDVVKMFAETRALIRNSELDNDDCVALGINNTAFAMTMVEEQRNSELKKALFGKLITEGTFAFVISEARPHFAVILGYNPVDHMSLRGNSCYFRGRNKHRIVMANRYPNSKFNAMALRIVTGKDEEEYCEGVCVLSWSTLFNVDLKGDYDGDTPLFTFCSKEEEEFIVKNYDFDAVFCPDNGEDVDIEEFVKVMLDERTINPGKFIEICKANGFNDNDVFGKYALLYRAY